MITIDEFFNKYNGKGIDFDNFYGFQCVDLAQQYNQEAINAPRLTGNAADIWDSYPKNFYTRISNTPTGVPQKGDIVIWNKALNGVGHIAVFKEGNVNTFVSFDQNWPTGSKCHFQNHNYNFVLGWLRPKLVKNWDIVVDRMRTALTTGGDSESRAKEADKIFHS